MKRLIAFTTLLWALGASLALAQISPPCYTTTGRNCIPVGTPETGTGAWGALPVTGTITVNNLNTASLQVSSTPTISTSAYAAGNCIGGFNAVTVTNDNGQSGFINNFRINSLTGATPVLTVFLFDSQPSTSICTDKGPFSLSAADVDKLIASSTITLSALTSVTSPSTASLDFVPPRPFIAGGSLASGVKTIYYGMVTNAITPASISDFHLRIGTSLN